MKKYYCPTCKRFKNRLQLKKEDDTRTYWFTCRWCHNSNIYLTEHILEKLIDKSLIEEDLSHILRGKVMECKTCSNCGHAKWEYGGVKCTRFPSWIFISEPDKHWCGEWKEKENQEEQDD